jgi:hypothetical protein
VFAGRLVGIDTEESANEEEAKDYWSFEADGNNDQSVVKGGGGGRGEFNDEDDEPPITNQRGALDASNLAEESSSNGQPNGGGEEYNELNSSINKDNIMDAGLCELNVNIQFGPRAGPPAAPHVHSLHGIASLGTNHKHDKSIEVKYNVVMVTPSASYKGELILTRRHVYFEPLAVDDSFHENDKDNAASAPADRINEDEGLKRWPRRERWPLKSVEGIYLRRFRLRDTGLEVFWGRRALDDWQSDLKVCFFDFGSRLKDGVGKRVFY